MRARWWNRPGIFLPERPRNRDRGPDVAERTPRLWDTGPFHLECFLERGLRRNRSSGLAAFRPLYAQPSSRAEGRAVRWSGRWRATGGLLVWNPFQLHRGRESSKLETGAENVSDNKFDWHLGCFRSCSTQKENCPPCRVLERCGHFRLGREL